MLLQLQLQPAAVASCKTSADVTHVRAPNQARVKQEALVWFQERQAVLVLMHEILGNRQEALVWLQERQAVLVLMQIIVLGNRLVWLQVRPCSLCISAPAAPGCNASCLFRALLSLDWAP
jgi:hypothetical protein